MRFFLSLALSAFLLSASFNPALAGKDKTVAALKEAVAEVEKAGINTDKTKASVEQANQIIKYSWRMARHDVYRDAGKIFDTLILETKGSNVKIRKPDWL